MAGTIEDEAGRNGTYQEQSRSETSHASNGLDHQNSSQLQPKPHFARAHDSTIVIFVSDPRHEQEGDHEAAQPYPICRLIAHPITQLAEHAHLEDDRYHTGECQRKTDLLWRQISSGWLLRLPEDGVEGIKGDVRELEDEEGQEDQAGISIEYIFRP